MNVCVCGGAFVWITFVSTSHVLTYFCLQGCTWIMTSTVLCVDVSSASMPMTSIPSACRTTTADDNACFEIFAFKLTPYIVAVIPPCHEGEQLLQRDCYQHQIIPRLVHFGQWSLCSPLRLVRKGKASGDATRSKTRDWMFYFMTKFMNLLWKICTLKMLHDKNGHHAKFYHLHIVIWLTHTTLIFNATSINLTTLS